MNPSRRLVDVALAQRDGLVGLVWPDQARGQELAPVGHPRVTPANQSLGVGGAIPTPVTTIAARSPGVWLVEWTATRTHAGTCHETFCVCRGPGQGWRHVWRRRSVGGVRHHAQYGHKTVDRGVYPKNPCARPTAGTPLVPWPCGRELEKPIFREASRARRRETQDEMDDRPVRSRRGARRLHRLRRARLSVRVVAGLRAFAACPRGGQFDVGLQFRQRGYLSRKTGGGVRYGDPSWKTRTRAWRRSGCSTT